MHPICTQVPRFSQEDLFIPARGNLIELLCDILPSVEFLFKRTYSFILIYKMIYYSGNQTFQSNLYNARVYADYGFMYLVASVIVSKPHETTPLLICSTCPIITHNFVTHPRYDVVIILAFAVNIDHNLRMGCEE